ncbi:MAG: 4-(cytidine 5'-diphospho)-2-C-methyl-D-erythritol kinase, partial [Thermodesulfovibrionales bacterium]
MLSIKSPAKINWYLRVLNKRDDGFHNIETAMQTVSLFDYITLEPSEDIEVSMTPSLGIKMEENIAYKTVLTLKKLTKTQRGVKILIKKQIPDGAGLGGGSSNAATTLLALNYLWRLNLDIKRLSEISKLIGSDVTFFLNSSPAIVRGKGDIVEPLDIKKNYKVVIVKPDVSISTAWAYGQLQRDKGYQRQSDTISFKKFLTEGDLKSMRDQYVNDFEEVVFKRYPELEDIKNGFLKVGAGYAAMSGSGSSIYGVFADDSYKRAYDLYSPHYKTWVVDTL